MKHEMHLLKVGFLINRGLIKEKGEYGFHYRVMKRVGSGSAGAFRKSSTFYVFSGERKKRMQNL